jgi:short-subunit dehydrogenase
MPRDLANLVMIITGASSGIGEATAIAAANAGMDVVINARRAERLEALQKQIISLGRQAEIVAGDVIELKMADRLLDAAMSRYGRFDFVFANAGYGFDRPMIEMTDQQLREMFEVNFFAGVDLLKKGARRLIDQKKPGHLLMCSSCLAKFTLPNSAAYCATKAAQNHVCRAMNIELRPHRIRVSSVHPIGTRTEFFSASARRSGKADRSAQTIAEAPRLFMQPPQRVADAVIRCLRRPRPEVWTSFSVRFGAAFMTLFPAMGEWILERAERRMP